MIWHNIKRRYLEVLVLLLSCVGCGGVERGGAPSRGFSIAIGVSRDNGVFEAGEFLQVYGDICNKGGSERTAVLWKIESDEGAPLKEFRVEVNLKGAKEFRTYCPVYEVPGPGFYRVTCSIGDVSDSMFVGYDPEGIDPAVTGEGDIDAFWAEALAELRGIDPEYNLILQKDRSNDDRDVYAVEMKSLGGLTVRGWLEVPKKKGVYPALLRVPGYGSNMEPVGKFDDMVVFSLNPRSHGDSDDAPGAPLEMWVRGLDDERDYFYRGAYMDCVRAMDLLASRDDVDAGRIAVWGGSQGGGLSFMTAALDDRVSFCVADVPWLCDFVRYLKTTHWEEIDEWLAADGRRNWREMFVTLSYFDTMNVAGQIKCEVLMGIGLQDRVCPPATSFATFNKIAGKKEYRVYVGAGHDLGAVHEDFGYEWLRRRFGL